MERILLVEDDPVLSRNITDALTDEALVVETVFDGMLADKMLRKNSYDCAVIDVNLPGKNGFEITKDFRQHNRATPVLILTAFGELEDKVQGYESGADDYLTKPFYMKELILRVKALLKRKGGLVPDSGKTIVVGDITMNLQSKKVLRQGKEVLLTPREYQILLRLVESKGDLVLKKDLVQEIWGHSFDVNTNVIEVYINFLRNKLDKPFGRHSIKTKIGYGYYFDPA